jgi:hypothetical protein
MGNDLSSPDVQHGTTPFVDATSEYQKQRLCHRDFDKDSNASTHFLSHLLDWDDNAAAKATVRRVHQRAVKKYHFDILDEESNFMVMKPCGTLWYMLYACPVQIL